jgi:serine-type D-Ala-D-Ala carboxypeptidase (penicillin-binding protein 5/6)
VRNPSGLDAPGQYTSAYDLAVLARTAMARQDFRDYVSTVKAQFPGKMPRAGKVRKTFEIYTQDRLLLNYRGAIGVKTGWTTKARGTFVGAATRGDRTLVATVLRSEGNDGWRDSADLLTWGFRNAAVAQPVGTLDAVTPVAGDKAAGRSGPSAEPHAAGVTTEGAGGLPWWLTAPMVLLACVALLRLRVLLRRRVRRRAPLPPLPQSRPRRLSTPASPAPTAAPTTTPRTVKVLRDDPSSSAPTGTGT